MSEKKMRYDYFTLVFEGDIRKFRNPLTTMTPFGIAFAASVGDALAERDQLDDLLHKHRIDVEALTDA